MDGDVDTMWALVKEETGKGCKEDEVLLLSGGKEEKVVLMLFDNLEIIVGPVESGGRGFTLLMFVTCLGEAVTALLVLAGDLVKLSWLW